MTAARPERCRLHDFQPVKCDGEFFASEGLCLRHACLFDIWIAEADGYRVYDSPHPRAWKRRKFTEWLSDLTEADVVAMLKG